jgi:predicted nucleotide-binding protein
VPTDLLKEEILRYERRGFEIVQRRKLKHGLRVFLKKKGEGWGSGFEGVYLYYVDGSASADSIRECLRDYVRFYEDEDFGEGDKGLFLCSSVDEKLFRDLKKVKIEDEQIRNSIKPIVLERTVGKATGEEPSRTIKEKQKVFIVHGRDRLPALELKVLIEEKYPIKVILLEKEAHAGKTLPEKLEEYSDVDYAFITLTPDDLGALKGEPLRERGRQNVIFEWGLFQGKIKRKNMCILIKGDIEIPSDLIGIMHYRFRDSVDECFLGIDTELRKAELI